MTALGSTYLQKRFHPRSIGLMTSRQDSVGRELVQLIRDMDIDEQASLVALAWVGRGTY